MFLIGFLLALFHKMDAMTDFKQILQCTDTVLLGLRTYWQIVTKRYRYHTKYCSAEQIHWRDNNSRGHQGDALSHLHAFFAPCPLFITDEYRSN